MKLPVSLFLAIKYLRPKRSMVSIITVLTMLGIALGVAVLIVVLSVMTGFDDEHKSQMIKLDSHIKVSARSNYNFNPDPVLESLKRIPEVTAAAPVIEGFVMIIREGQSITAMMRGVDPEQERKITDIEGYLVAGAFDLSKDQVVIGDRLAMSLGTWVGDTLTVYSPQCFVSEDELRLPQEVTVGGIFSIGVYNVDSQFMIGSLPTARDTFAMESGVQALRVLTTDPYKVDIVSQQIEAEFKSQAATAKGPSWLRRLVTQTWAEIHQDLLSTLKVEKDMMFILLCGISLVATMSVTNTLITLCIQKTHEIGLLKSLGFSSGSVVGIFFLLGSVQGFFGCVVGVIMGISVSANLDVILNLLRMINPGLMSAQFYQFSEMPAHTTLSDVLSVCIIVMIFSTLAGVLPAWRAAKMEPVDALRYE
jgi:lipoprotein-releasing system permease protein